MSHFLTQAVNELTSQGIYYIPKAVIDKVQINLILQNPPYAIRERNTKNIKQTPYK